MEFLFQFLNFLSFFHVLLNLFNMIFIFCTLSLKIFSYLVIIFSWLIITSVILNNTKTRGVWSRVPKAYAVIEPSVISYQIRWCSDNMGLDTIPG